MLRTGDSEALRIPIREALATTVTASPDADFATGYIALVQVAARESAGAVITARRIQEPTDRAQFLAIVAWAQASLGDLTAAEATLHEALSVPQEGEHQGEMLDFVALVQAHLSNIDQALATSDQIADPSRRAMVLVAIATGRLPYILNCNS